ncbi:MAG: 50S ribosomal protein L22 [Candidatus Schekmanbacteria bacterium]|nr:50S ribosomal protein L22 [Candidatus Schekmanbacteria bacterium]
MVTVNKSRSLGLSASPIRASARDQRISAYKARLVIDMIRNRPVENALDILRNSPKKAARLIERVVRSAVANAQQTHGVMDVEDLVVSRAFVDEGRSVKKWRPRAQGRANRILKRSSHITVELVQPGS